MQTKKLYRPTDDRAIFGVCSGIARYFDTDAIVIRLLMVLLALTAGAGIVFYIIAALIIPSEDKLREEAEAAATVGAYQAQTAYREAPAPEAETAGEEPVQTAYREAPEAETVQTAYREAPEAEAAGEEPVQTAEEAAAEADAACEPCAEKVAEGPGTVSGTFESEPEPAGFESQTKGPQPQAYQPDPAAPQAPYSAQAAKSRKRRQSLGMLLVAIGLIVVLKILFRALNLRLVIAIALIFYGIYLIFKKPE